MINKDNYEEMLVRYAEGDLRAEEKAAVEAFLEANAWAREELELFLGAPTLMPCAKEFEGEEELKRGFVVQFPWRTAFRAAACVALMVVAGVKLWYRPITEDRLPACPQMAAVPAAVEPEGALLAEVSAPAGRPGRMPGLRGQAGSLTSVEEALPQEALPVASESREAVAYVEQVDADEFYSLLAMLEPDYQMEEPWTLVPEEQPWLPLEESTLPVLPMEPVQESLLARLEDNAQRLRGIWQHMRNIFFSSTELLLAYNEQEY